MTYDQIFALVTAHADRDEARFKRTVAQIAAGLKDERKRDALKRAGDYLVALPVEAKGLVYEAPRVSLDDLTLESATRETIEVITAELRSRLQLMVRGIPPRCRLLFSGPPGNGKSSVAAGIADRLGTPAYILSIPSVIAGYMGATAGNLEKAFSLLRGGHVLIADELDALGSARVGGDGAASKEFNVTLTALLTLLDRDRDGTLIATTNRTDLLDPALVRRFDEVIEFPAPDQAACLKLASKLCEKFGIAITDVRGWIAPSFDAVTKSVVAAARAKVMAEIAAMPAAEVA
jgi:SpoVK/Ycf46/Vps4 family AAA+-type ATPase